MNKPTLGVVMIVKNESAMLAECLESVKGADFITIVDTGSVDNTKEIANKYTNKVLDFVWCDDFAQARNFALQNANGDFLLSIDADEVLEEGGIEKIRAFIENSDKKSFAVKMRTDGNEFFVPRVFKKDLTVFWVGRIHEILNTPFEEIINVSITYRSSPAHAIDPQRNIRILEKAYEDEPNNTRCMYYLGREYGYYQEWSKAKVVLEKYVSMATWLPEKADAFFILALCYWYDGMSNGEKARENCLKAININANFKAAIELMAHMSFEKNALQWRNMASTATNEDTLFNRLRSDII